MGPSLFVQHPLSPEAQSRLTRQHESELAELLPVLGPLFGVGMILFSLWDYLIDARHAAAALLVRVICVALSSAAYFPTRLRWTSTQRCGYIYWINVCAIILCEFLLERGFMHGLAGITACLFVLSVITIRASTFMLMLSVPSLLFVVLAYFQLSSMYLANTLALYGFCAGLAYLLMLVVRFFRRKAFSLQEEVLHLSRQDSLTGVYRRGYLVELAEREMAVARRHRRALAIAMLDIDHFKQVNDTYGHDIGDQVIKSLADSCVGTLRHIDHFGRIGGEEFVCVLPGTAAADAIMCAERLRRNIEALRVDTPKGVIRFTVSIGVALFDPETHADWTSLLKDADDAMYRAKREGRNRVVLGAGPSAISAPA